MNNDDPYRTAKDGSPSDYSYDLESNDSISTYKHITLLIISSIVIIVIGLWLFNRNNITNELQGTALKYLNSYNDVKEINDGLYKKLNIKQLKIDSQKDEISQWSTKVNSLQEELNGLTNTCISISKYNKLSDNVDELKKSITSLKNSTVSKSKYDKLLRRYNKLNK